MTLAGIAAVLGGGEKHAMRSDEWILAASPLLSSSIDGQAAGAGGRGRRRGHRENRRARAPTEHVATDKGKQFT